MASVDVVDVRKAYGAQEVIHGVSIGIKDGEFVILVGPSGCGKSTLLRMIAGLEPISSGDIRIGERVVNDLPPKDRDIAMVFQSYALYPHKTVAENMGFALKMRHAPKAEIESRVRRAAEILDLVPYLSRYPRQLSGGQRQRVALARALAIEPIVLLLDEPFGALDAKVRKELRRWLRRLNEETGMTSIFVTHDQEEAMEIADRVVVMSQGRIEQIGKPRDIYDHPANPFVCEFLGTANRIPLSWAEGKMKNPAIELDAITVGPASVGAENVYVRPHDIDIVKDAAGTGTVRFLSVVGPMARVDVEIAGAEKPIEVDLPAHRLSRVGIEVGAPVRLSALKGHVY